MKVYESSNMRLGPNTPTKLKMTHCSTFLPAACFI